MQTLKKNAILTIKWNKYG